MSKNNKYRNFQYNNGPQNNSTNPNQVIESSEDIIDNSSDEVMMDTVDAVEVASMETNEEYNTVETVSTVDTVNEVTEHSESFMPEIVEMDITFDAEPEGHDDPVGEPGESGVDGISYETAVDVAVSEFKYEIATDLTDGQTVNYKTGTNDFDEACKIANDETKNTGLVHHVYNDQGFVVFSAKKKLTLLTNKKRGNKNVNWYS